VSIGVVDRHLGGDVRPAWESAGLLPAPWRLGRLPPNLKFPGAWFLSRIPCGYNSRFFSLLYVDPLLLGGVGNPLHARRSGAKFALLVRVCVFAAAFLVPARLEPPCYKYGDDSRIAENLVARKTLVDARWRDLGRRGPSKPAPSRAGASILGCGKVLVFRSSHASRSCLAPPCLVPSEFGLRRGSPRSRLASSTYREYLLLHATSSSVAVR